MSNLDPHHVMQQGARENLSGALTIVIQEKGQKESPKLKSYKQIIKQYPSVLIEE